MLGGYEATRAPGRPMKVSVEDAGCSRVKGPGQVRGSSARVPARGPAACRTQGGERAN